ncbi:MAG: ArsB/NhaD family transporter [Coriobacteriales bacterium]|jgi:Na+/H+ antiporter NhaD/arsenite permease-like protein|nr:ArsB/NhaD family transporter [Coriobacteriales bacterium]
MAGNAQIAFTVTVFLLTYAIIITEKIHRTLIALFGASLMLVFGILSFEMAIEAIDFNAIGLLVGMMLIVGLTRESGVIEFIAISVAKFGKGHPIYIMLSLSILTAIMSALIDNVTMILLTVPISISIARKLEIDPIPIVFSEILLSNIGGAATLIGDPPNLLIGSAAGFGFMDFVVNLVPVLIVISVATLFILWLIFRKKMIVSDENRQRLLSLNPRDELRDKPLAIKSLTVMAITIIGFIIHQYVNLESAAVAMAGASLLLLVTRPNPDKVFQHVEWPVIFFFIGLFVLVGSLEAIGVMEEMAHLTIALTGGELVGTGMSILFVSAIAGAFLDNIPFTATMIPLIQEIGRIGAIEGMDALWWCLALGACLGGNGTVIGASANVTAIGLLEEEGHKFSFLRYLVMGFPLMLMSIAFAAVYMYFFYLT